VSYDALPIELGQIGGVRTRIQILAVPGAAEQAPTRKQLLDQVDGVVFVADTQPDRIEANIASLEELRAALASYGRALEEIPLVVQYNKRDQSDPYALEELHRKLGMQNVAAFEAVASSGTGVLQTLTTISKRVIRHLRKRGAGDPAPARSAESAPFEPGQPVPPPGMSQILETAVAPPGASAGSGENGIDESAALDPALVYDLDHPDGAAIEATAAETEAAFEPSFRHVTVDLESPTPGGSEPDAQATMGALRIESVGEVSQAGSGTVRIPIVLRDEAGRSLAISLNLEIQASETETTD
jgi:hypothetical protein